MILAGFALPIIFRAREKPVQIIDRWIQLLKADIRDSEFCKKKRFLSRKENAF